MRRIPFLILLLAGALAAEDGYVVCGVDGLHLDGPLPTEDSGQAGWRFRPYEIRLALAPYAALAGEGEAFAHAQRLRDLWDSSPLDVSKLQVAIRAPAGVETKGWLFLPKRDWSGMVRIGFSVTPVAGDDARKQFEAVRGEAREDIAARGLPGGAWFRTRAESDGAKLSLPPARASAPRREDDLDRTFAIFSGATAVSENLQLDRGLLVREAGKDATVEVASLPGIEVQAFDWSKLKPPQPPEADPLAARVPGDQHGIFFASFDEMLRALDAADAYGTPVSRALEPSAEDALTRARYQHQLCLEVTELARRFGAQAIASVAITGGDPYLRQGSDVAVLLEAKQPQLVAAFLAAGRQAAATADPAVTLVEGQVGGFAYHGAVDPDRRVCSYAAALDDSVIVVTNSLAQLERLARVASGKEPSLAAAPEYPFFRDRYHRGTGAFLLLPDAAIRRWCSARWRIGDSRRQRAYAALEAAQARHAAEIIAGHAAPAPAESDLDLAFDAQGVRSQRWGTIGFMTPIGELDLGKATAEEAAAYERFRDTYEEEWRWFDPIALSLDAQPGVVTADLTVMPLILGSEYGILAALAGEAAIPRTAGDPHPETMLRLAFAIDRSSQPARELGLVLGGMGFGRERVDPLGWLGPAVSVYLDEDPVWEELIKSEDADRFLSANSRRLPAALQIEVGNAVSLAAFLTALHAFVEQSAPGLVKWDNPSWHDHPYVRISATERMAAQEADLAQVAVYLLTNPDGVVVSLDEDLIKRAIDRADARAKGQAPATTTWQGKSLGLHLDRRLVALLERLGASPLASALDLGQLERQRQLSWANLPILTEWHRLFPGEDPVAVHERLFKTRLVCPGGGTYVWNEEWRTMESTVYGHPGQPKNGPMLPRELSAISAADAGVTFENGGLRARVVLDVTPPKP